MFYDHNWSPLVYTTRDSLISSKTGSYKYSLPYTSTVTKLGRITWKPGKRPSSRIRIPLSIEGITGFRLIKTTVAKTRIVLDLTS
jgi:hypothetical protein